MARELAQKSPSGRPRRESITKRNRLRVKNPDPNFVYRFVNDQEDRVEILKEYGYEVAPPDSNHATKDKRVDVGESIGSAPSIAVGNGTRAVLMRIPKDWYDEAQAEKLQELTKLEDSIRNPKTLGRESYGKVEFTRD
jgi:hypothetical protein